MVEYRRLLSNTCLILLIVCALAACNKTDNSLINKQRSDFIGTWKGNLVNYDHGKRVVQKYEWMVYTDSTNGRLAGLLTLTETNRLEELQFSDGTWYFRVVNSDSLNPSCREWNFAGYAKFGTEGTIEFNLAGNKCGPIGDQFVSWGGTMSKVSDTLDPAAHFDFIRGGNSWTYKITKNNSDTCTLGYNITADLKNGVFEGMMTNQCNWNWSEKHFSWAIDPSRFSVLPNDTSAIPLSVFTLDMTLGKVYRFRSGFNISITALLKRNEEVTVPSGKFVCNKYQVESYMEWDTPSSSILSYYWISNRYGIVKREVLNPADSTSLKLQVLTWKNF